MRRYWINFKGQQKGPLSIEELASMGVDKSAYVWHSGLDDWVKITKVPELNEMLENMGDKPVDLLLPDEDEVPELPQEVDEVPELPQEHKLPEPEPIDITSGMLNNDVRPEKRHPRNLPPRGANFNAVSQNPAAPEEQPKCPPTNLVWSIILTVLCCTPAGVIGIIFAILTKKHYRRGNYDKAERFSEYGAWACIASIILGIITAPFSWVMQMLG